MADSGVGNHAAFARFGRSVPGIGGDEAAKLTYFAGFVAAAVCGLNEDIMVTRTKSHTVTFLRPFILDGFERIQAAGSYIVDTEEELMQTVLFPTWKRLSTVIRLKILGATEHLPVDPEQLHEALMRDGAQQDPTLPLSHQSPKARRDWARGQRHLPVRTRRKS